MKARIYLPTRTAMQSGSANTHEWHLDFLPETKLYVEPLMGWSGSTDNSRQLKMHFATKEEAIDYAQRNHISYVVEEPKLRIIKPKSYSANFSFNRVS